MRRVGRERRQVRRTERTEGSHGQKLYTGDRAGQKTERAERTEGQEVRKGERAGSQSKAMHASSVKGDGNRVASVPCATGNDARAKQVRAQHTSHR